MKKDIKNTYGIPNKEESTLFNLENGSKNQNYHNNNYNAINNIN